MAVSGSFDFSKLEKDLFNKMKKRFSVSIGFKGSRVVRGREVKNKDIALWNFYGTKNIPARNPLNKISLKGIEKQKDFKNFLEKKGGRFNQLDKFLKLRVKQAFYRKYIKNAPSTIRQKGFNQPLIWTGALRDSVAVETKEMRK